MKTKNALELAGGTSALASLLEITPGAVSQWGDDMPDQRIWQLKVLRPEWFKEPKVAKTWPQAESVMPNGLAHD
jgi:hypothetical protein